jgi:hypothetical protein
MRGAGRGKASNQAFHLPVVPSCAVPPRPAAPSVSETDSWVWRLSASTAAAGSSSETSADGVSVHAGA